MNYKELLDHSYKMNPILFEEQQSKLEYLSDYIFSFTTYDAGMSELFAQKAVEVCDAITNRSTFDYIADEHNYQWYLLMVNMPFFENKLNWGSSIRGAWWDVNSFKLESCGLWKGDDQLLELELDANTWEPFIRAVVDFAKD